jgi:hypothetical protein
MKVSVACFEKKKKNVIDNLSTAIMEHPLYRYGGKSAKGFSAKGFSAKSF